MREILKKEECSGCTACMNVCPKHAISFEKEQDGFKYPIINQKKCIDCGLCKRICPVLNTSKNDSLDECYVAYCTDKKEVLNASSGSIFSVIANNVLDNNGIVVGAAFNKNNILQHIAIEKKADLNPLRKSKYLQSDLNDIFKYIKEKIKTRTVLFVGTPCQVAGLKSFIKKSDNLISIDLFCHGVPSPKLFEKYILELENANNDVVVNYDFRDNSTGWDTYSNKITFKNKELIIDRTKSEYMQLFLSDIALRESCYNCNFKLGNKYSDITLGDFWGVKKFYPEMYNKEGVSAIIVNTDLGNKIFNNISDNLIYKKCNLDEIISGNPSLLKSSKKPNKRNGFFDEIDNNSISYLAEKYKRKKSIINKVKYKIKKMKDSIIK